MLFNTWTFACFFVVVYSLYRLLPRRPQNVLLLIASYVFYGYWDYRFLTLIWISTVLDFFCGQALGRTSGGLRRRFVLVLSVAGNLSILGFFKYFDFFAYSFTRILLTVGFQPDIPTLNVVLPVGISFYTFQTMSYTIDIYRGRLRPTAAFLDFAVFVAFFPQLVAGPIERARDLLPQFARPRAITRERLRTGVWLVFWGLFKKIVVADNMAPIVNQAFASPASYQGMDLLFAVYAFALQIYGDFSGYSDMARGLANLLGFDLRVNFSNPYFAVAPSDFWRRWHISLSSWLRDYLYIPLGGNRGNRWAMQRNLMLTMLLGGLWHGAGWTFVVWGAYHGLLLSVYRLVPRWVAYESARTRYMRVLWRLALIVAMFHLTCVGWLIFRAQDMGTVMAMLNRIVLQGGLSGFGIEWLRSLAFYASFLLAVDAWQSAADDEAVVVRQHWFVRLNIWLFVLASLAFCSAHTGQEFIYFEF